jgi:hypothetical protein
MHFFQKVGMYAAVRRVSALAVDQHERIGVAVQNCISYNSFDAALVESKTLLVGLKALHDLSSRQYQFDSHRLLLSGLNFV